MTTPLTITATLKAWSTGDYCYRNLMDALRENKHQDAAEQMVYSNASMDGDGWAYIGDAEITVHLQPRDDITARQVAALQQELDKARAEWMTKQQAILERINKLQALTYEVETPAPAPVAAMAGGVEDDDLPF
jgi:hypothetical protein